MVNRSANLVRAFTANKKTTRNSRKLLEILKSSVRLLIVMQDNPDPDAIAAAIALRKLANTTANLRCSFAHGGTIGRGENRALVRYLNLNLYSCLDIEFDKFSTIAMVDTQPGMGNNSLPEGIIPDIVIDHHSLKKLTRSVRFFDVRPRYGATSTILLEYLSAAGIILDVPLATSLLYAIRSDTQDLGREANAADIQAVTLLFPLANKRMLGEIERGSVPREYFQMLARALQSARVYSNAIVAHLTDVDTPDMIAEVADLLLREDNTAWTMCTGFFGEKMLISLRTQDEKNRADLVIKRIVSRKGTGGGHLSYAGGQIPLDKISDRANRKLEKTVQGRFLKAIHCDSVAGDNLIKH
jgi:nanoRNase/pAp phosphatase (c-di-AMP/oligoRNAs hydrolase)